MVLWLLQDSDVLIRLDVLIRCLLCIPVGDDGCLTDGHVALWCLDALVADVEWVSDDYVVDGHMLLSFDVVVVVKDCLEIV